MIKIDERVTLEDGLGVEIKVGRGLCIGRRENARCLTSDARM